MKLPPWSRMHPVLNVGWLRPYYAFDVLAAAPNDKENSADYTDLSEYQVLEKILENKVTR